MAEKSGILYQGTSATAGATGIGSVATVDLTLNTADKIKIINRLAFTMRLDSDYWNTLKIQFDPGYTTYQQIYSLSAIPDANVTGAALSTADVKNTDVIYSRIIDQNGGWWEWHMLTFKTPWRLTDVASTASFLATSASSATSHAYWSCHVFGTELDLI